MVAIYAVDTLFLHPTDANRGFGFVQYFVDEDAAAALDNMDGSELEGRVLRVNIAKPMRHKLGAAKPGVLLLVLCRCNISPASA